MAGTAVGFESLSVRMAAHAVCTGQAVVDSYAGKTAVIAPVTGPGMADFTDTVNNGRITVGKRVLSGFPEKTDRPDTLLWRCAVTILDPAQVDVSLDEFAKTDANGLAHRYGGVNRAFDGQGVCRIADNLIGVIIPDYIRYSHIACVLVYSPRGAGNGYNRPRCIYIG